MWNKEYFFNKEKTTLNEPVQTSEPISVFSNMFSLIRNFKDEASWPISLDLPDPFEMRGNESIQLPSMLTKQNSMLQSEAEYSAGDILKRKSKAVNACPHADRKHYAKNMCNNCYHRLGREKMAWACPHDERPHYAKGKCQFCYLQHYHRTKVFGKRRNNKRRV